MKIPVRKIRVYNEGKDYCLNCGKPIPFGKELCNKCKRKFNEEL